MLSPIPCMAPTPRTMAPAPCACLTPFLVPLVLCATGGGCPFGDGTGWQNSDVCVSACAVLGPQEAGAAPSAAGLDEGAVQVMEGQLTWLVHIIGAIIRGDSATASKCRQRTLTTGPCRKSTGKMVQTLK